MEPCHWNPQNTSRTKWDFLRDSIVENMKVSLLSPAVVKQILWDSYLKKEIVTEKQNQEKKEEEIKVKTNILSSKNDKKGKK